MEDQNNPINIHFSKTIDDYDIIADCVVMKNDELHEVIVDSLQYHSHSNLDILDLGSGTAHGMLLLFKKFPLAKITGVDFSHKMIQNARKNLMAYIDRIDLRKDDFNTMVFDKQFDVIVSAVAIHNSSHEQKKLIFEKIYTGLKNNGVFVNGDFIEAEDQQINEEYKQIYKNYLENNLSGNELQVWLKHAFIDDKPMRLSEQFKLLKTVGFKEINLVWQFNNMAVYVAKK
ncbi:class I SAM-dependent methyltransferase [Candidatus Woesearchaeota archaeon]|nr:class I SAM-dependent methyltransferase [Candidatus Woesearchaeota archaeon]